MLLLTMTSNPPSFCVNLRILKWRDQAKSTRGHSLKPHPGTSSTVLPRHGPFAEKPIMGINIPL